MGPAPGRKDKPAPRTQGWGHKLKQVRKSQGGARKKKGGTVSHKNRIRGALRLLNKEGLHPRARKREEQRLEELRAQAEAAGAAERERALALRYHKVRFFERVKLERRLKRAEAARGAAGAGTGARADTAAAQALDAELAQLQRALQYVRHFPKGEKYVALLKDPEDPGQLAIVQGERARLHALVQRQRAEAALLAEPDEGLGSTAPPRDPPTSGDPVFSWGLNDLDLDAADAPRSMAAGRGPALRFAPAGLGATAAADPLGVGGGDGERDDFFLPGTDEGEAAPSSREEGELLPSRGGGETAAAAGAGAAMQGVAQAGGLAAGSAESEGSGLLETSSEASGDEADSEEPGDVQPAAVLASEATVEQKPHRPAVRLRDPSRPAATGLEALTRLSQAANAARREQAGGRPLGPPVATGLQLGAAAPRRQQGRPLAAMGRLPVAAEAGRAGHGKGKKRPGESQPAAQPPRRIGLGGGPSGQHKRPGKGEKPGKVGKAGGSRPGAGVHRKVGKPQAAQQGAGKPRGGGGGVGRGDAPKAKADGAPQPQPQRTRAEGGRKRRRKG